MFRFIKPSSGQHSIGAYKTVYYWLYINVLWLNKILYEHSQTPVTSPYLSHISPIHASPSHVLKINFNITLPSNLTSSYWSPSLKSPHRNPVGTSPVSHTWHMPLSFHFSWFDQKNNVWRGAQIIKLLVMQSSPNLSYLVPLGPKQLPTEIALYSLTEVIDCFWNHTCKGTNSRKAYTFLYFSCISVSRKRVCSYR